jgi:hypothetical protein
MGKLCKSKQRIKGAQHSQHGQIEVHELLHFRILRGEQTGPTQPCMQLATGAVEKRGSGSC